MEPAGDGASPGVGRATFESHCAQCHGIAGEGGYLGAGLRAPAIAGATISKIEHQVREGSEQMPALPSPVLSDVALASLGTYVRETLSHPTGEAAGFGPPALDPLVVGLVVWTGLALFACGLALVFGGGRN